MSTYRRDMVGVKSICIELPNNPGKLTTISELFGQQSVSILALCVIDRKETAGVRFIVDDHARALKALKAKEIPFDEREVLAAEVPDHPGGLSALLKPLRDASVNVLYLYPFMGRNQKNATLIIEVDQIEKAKSVLSNNWVRLHGQELHSL
jgi:hypothetical protein